VKGRLTQRTLYTVKPVSFNFKFLDIAN
jgi:hypothetical protein